jgi:hypothetical protein
MRRVLLVSVDESDALLGVPKSIWSLEERRATLYGAPRWRMWFIIGCNPRKNR